MSNINSLIRGKIKKYPLPVQKLLFKAIELAKFNHETAIAEQLEGVLRDITKNEGKVGE